MMLSGSLRRTAPRGLVALLLVLVLSGARAPDAVGLESASGAWSERAIGLLERAAPAPVTATTAGGIFQVALDGPAAGPFRAVRAPVEPARLLQADGARPDASPSGHPGGTPLSPLRTSLPPPPADRSAS